MLKIEVKDQITLAQLSEYNKSGMSVVQTPHVGGLPIDVLIALQTGFHVRLVDTNIGHMDKLFYPHLLIRNGSAFQVADANTLVTHAVVSENAKVVTEHFQPGGSLASAHTNAARAAFPGSDIVSYADWLLPHRNLVLSFLEVITRLHPRVWERRVDYRGMTVNAQSAGILPTWDLLMKEGICGITIPANAAGWVLPNPIAILVDIIVDAAYFGRSVQWPLSGPSMASYIQQNHRDFGPMDKLLSYWYEQVRTQLPQLKLPQKFVVNMVPAASWRFAVPRSLSGHLNELIGWYFDYKRRQIDVSQGIAMGVLQPKEVGAIKRARREGLRRIADPISLWLATQETPQFATQYDVLEYQAETPTTQPLYVHPIVMNTSVKSLAQVFAFIKAIAV